jgi:Tfp pilus assembly protein PilN
MLAFFLSPFGRLLAVGLISLSVGGIGGWRLHKRIADGAMLAAVTSAYKQKVATIEDRMKRVNAAAQNDQKRAADAETARKQAEDLANELQTKVPDTQCYSPADTDELRGLWSHPAAPGKPRRPAAGAR